MTNYSISLENQNHFGSIGDLSLSGGYLNFSMSIWTKFTHATGVNGATICGNLDSQNGLGGWALDSNNHDGIQPSPFVDELEAVMINENHTYTQPRSPSDVSGLYGLITETTTSGDNNWHNTVITYEGGGVGTPCTSVVDGTHLEVASTAGMAVGDLLFQAYYTTTIVSIPDSTHLEVVSTTNFTSDSTNGLNNVYVKGFKIYFDGVLITIFADFQYPDLGSDYSSPLPFGIGDVQQTVQFSRIAKYAYPAFYDRTLTPAEVTRIANKEAPPSGAIAQWFFTEGTGLTAADSSGNSHTLTFNAIDEWSTDVPFQTGTNYSVWLQDKTHFGAVGDLSLSTGQTFMSMSLWFKSTVAYTSQANTLCGNQDVQAGMGGWNILMFGGDGSGDGQLEFDTANQAFTSPYNQPSSVQGLYGQITPSLGVADGNWHNIIVTYDGTGVNRTVVSVPDSTHLELDDTTGILAGDKLSQWFYTTTVVSVVDSTHLEVVSSVNFTNDPTNHQSFIFSRGLIIYVDGVPFINTTLIDFQYPAMGNDYSVSIPFGIGSVQQLDYFTRIGKYAYPALYDFVLSPSQISYIASGHNLPGATAQWLFSEGTGLTASDNSGNNHTLTFNTIDQWSTDIPFQPVTNYSVWLQDKHHFGAVGDLSLSNGEPFFSASIWIKCDGGDPGTDAPGLQTFGNVDTVSGTGGWGMQQATQDIHDGGDAQMGMFVINDSIPSYSPPSVASLGFNSNSTTINTDGLWHNIVMTYDSTFVHSPSVSIPDSTHITVSSTSGMNAGDRIYQKFISTTITTVVDGTTLEVANSTGFIGGDFITCRGILFYLDGILQTTWADYEYSPVGASYSVDIPLGIGDPQQEAEFTRIAKYAYPSYYRRILTPSEITAIAAGGLVASGAEAQWLFTEGTGLTAADSSGNGHTLTFNVIDEWSTDVPFRAPPPPVPGAKKKAATILVF